MRSKDIKVFDVVELKDKNKKATILNISGDTCLVDIPDSIKRHEIINVSEIENIIYRKNKIQ